MSNLHKTLPQLLCCRAQDRADDVAYVFLPDGGRDEERRLTYSGLYRRACSVAAMLQARKLTGTAALLVYSPGLEFLIAFFGCLLAKVLAVPVYPPRPRGSLERFYAIWKDTEARVILGDTRNLSQLDKRADFEIAKAHRLNTETTGYGDEQPWQQPEVAPADIAFLQYTSGSTRGLKAVAIRHDSIMIHSALIRDVFRHTEASRGVICLPPYHDMGLIGGIIQPLYVGFPVVLISPLLMMQRPIRWLTAIMQYSATTSGGPNFFYELCVHRITPEERRGLDLSSWKVAFNGSEMVRPRTLRDFISTYSRCGFRREALYPCYGMAEATLMISGCRLDRPPVMHDFLRTELAQGHAIKAAEESSDSGETLELASCGQAPPESKIIIVDPKTRCRLEACELGEIWVKHNDSMPTGYWRRPEKTQRTFQASLANTGEGPYLATGDQGFFFEGELFIVGRRDDVLVIRGRNFHYKDLEGTVEVSHPSFRRGGTMVFDAAESGEPILVVAQELSRPYTHLNFAELKADIRQKVAAEHGLRVERALLLRPNTIPRTANGKLQRFACQEAFFAGKLTSLSRPAFSASSASSPEKT